MELKQRLTVGAEKVRRSISASMNGVWAGVRAAGEITGRAYSRITGEISKLRLTTGTLGGYKLDTSRVDYTLARELYENSSDKYKLGAGFAKPVINTCVGFMGAPNFRSEDPAAQENLDDFFGSNVSKMQQVHRDAMRDADCWVWLTREENPESKLLYPESGGVHYVFNIIPPEQIHHINRDPLTGRPIEYVLQSEHEWLNEAGEKKKGTIEQRISAEWRKVKVVDGDTPPGIQFEEGGISEEANHWGFLPIVQFSNERDSSAANGRSDLEPIEPFMKAYHDVMMQALQNHKIHSIPRLKMKLKDAKAFLQNNFGVDDPAKFAREGRTIKLEGKELLIFMENEDAEYIELQSPTGSTEVLLKFLFYCIVDTSETPEFAFGTHLPSSHASVKEQIQVLVRRVARKRSHFEDSWKQLARIYLAMRAQSGEGKYATYATELIWDPVADRDEKEISDTLLNIVNALAAAVDHFLISEESAVNFLSGYIETMAEYATDNPEQPGEGVRIIRDRLRRARLEDVDLADKEKDLIEEALKKMDETKKAG